MHDPAVSDGLNRQQISEVVLEVPSPFLNFLLMHVQAVLGPELDTGEGRQLSAIE